MPSLSSLGTIFSENFNSLVSTGTSSTLPAGWFIAESGANANGILTAGTGSSNSGDTYSFGSAGSTDRALGGLQSGNLIPSFGASFTNNTGASITSLLIGYKGEQWRLGATGRADRLDFQISFDATSLTTGTWIDVDALDFSSVVTTGAVGLLDGNENSTAISSTYNVANGIASGATFWIRWTDFNATGADDGLAIDDFTIVANGSSGPATPGTFGVAAASASEGAGFLTFTVTRTGGTSGAATVSYAVTAGTATASDFTGGALPSGSVVFADGQTSATIQIAIANDSEVESDETFTLTLTGTTAGAIGAAAATGTIVNDDFPPTPVANVFINEIHYDNAGTDAGEAIEVAGRAGTNLAGWSLVLYNGNGGGVYGTIALSGTIADQSNGYGTVSFPAAGLQNGSPDGIALVDNLGRVIQFLSYEGTMVATGGPAQGMTSTDIGVVQESAAVGTSLSLVGTGSSYEDFTWVADADDSFGGVNAGQSFLSPDAPGQFRILDASVVEGNAGTADLVLLVRRAGGANETSTVDYTVALDGTATLDDLAPGAVLSGTLTFAPGVSVVEVRIPVLGDTVGERNETLHVTLSNAVNATIVVGTATGTIVNDDPQTLAIYEIQGERHQSEYAGQIVTTTGIVTAVASNGFYLQDPTGDGNSRTSDAIFVFTNTAPTVQAGYAISVTGAVREFLPGNNATNLTVTQIVASDIAVDRDGNGNPTLHALPAAVLIGINGVLPPTDVFDNDNFTIYDPENDAADFYESLEGMRATVDAPIVVDRTNSFNETWVVASGGRGSTGLNNRGGMTISGNADNFDDYNPERIQLDDGLFAGYNPNYTQGDRLSNVTGVFSYDFQSYELLVTEAVTITKNKPEPTREVTDLVGDAEHLTMATYNVENLDPGDGKFNILASDIVYHLRAPDIIALQEIQDADGAGSGSDLSGYVTAQGLIDAIKALGGPDYVYIEITPSAPGTTGGEPGGNIRNGFLYNASRVDYVENSAALVPGAAFNGSRSPLAATFNFNGEDVTAISVHSTSRSGSEALFGSSQPANSAGEAARIAQSEAIRAYVTNLLSEDTEARIAVLGDFNGFYFEQSLELLEEGGVLSNLYRTLPEQERYSYMFGGNAQGLDNFLVSGSLLTSALFDAVHINSEQADTPARGTDHDPLVASFHIPAAPTAPSLEIDLSNYVRVGRYDLPEPTRTSAPANNLLAQEVSAVTWNWDTDTLFVVGDGGTAIVEVSKTGQLISTMTLAQGNSSQGTEFFDPEGLAYIGNGQFVMTEERDRNAVLFTYVANTTLTRAAAQTANLGTNVGNVGLEGLTYDPLTGGYIFVKEKDPEGVFQTTIDFATNTASNGSATTVNSTNLFDPGKLGVVDLADVYALSNLSTIGVNDKGNLLVLSQESAKILEVDRNGNILSTLNLVSDPGNPLDIVSQQHEGIAVDKNGFIYVVSENGGGDFNHPQLWVYAPSSVPNQAPTAIALTNATAAIEENTSTVARIKVADVAITDDGLGNNLLSLSGADAQYFEVDSTGLYIKAGTVLDYETKTSYSVTVLVDDPNVGGSPDASVNYVLSVTDVTNESALPAIYISEVAAWSSGNSPVGADWFEVTNGGSSTVNLTGWKMDDSSGAFATAVALNGVTSIKPGESVIFLETSTPAATIQAFIDTWFNGVAPAGLQFGTYSGGGVGLSTGGDGVVLFNAAGQQQASVSFGSSPNGPFATFDNALGVNGGTITQLSQAGERGAFAAARDAAEIGSPGTVGRLSITEVAPWSSGDSPVGADWFELTNNTAFAIDITGWKMDDSSGSPAAAVALNGITTIKPGESVIFLETASQATVTAFIDTWFGGVAPAGLQIGTYTGGGVGLSTGGDAVNIYNEKNVLQASVSFGSSPTGTFATFDNTAGLNNTTITQLSSVGVNNAFTAVKHATEVGSPGDVLPTKAPNAAPTAITLVNATTAIEENTSTAARIKVADVTVTDDGQGTNTLLVSGTDAKYFEVDATGLYIKAGTVLDYEAKASYAITVSVDDVTVGGTPDASTAYTLNLTDVVNESGRNAITVTEVAPWSSGDSPIGADWFELTNNTGAAIDITGWKVDDNSASFAAAVALNGITSIAAGESVIFIESKDPAAARTAFINTWFGGDAPASLKIGTYTGSGIGLSTDGDAINIYNSQATLQASVTFGASTKGTLSTFDNTAGLNNTTISTLSVVGTNGAFAAIGHTTEVGSPGNIVPVQTVNAAAFDIMPASTAAEVLVADLKLVGTDAADTLIGDAGNDKLWGGLGADKLDGGLGDDYLAGGAGNDTLTGGAGNDVFAFDFGGGNDTITDFNVLEDKLLLASGINVAKTKVADLNGDGLSDLVLSFGAQAGSVTLLGVSSYAAVHIEQGNLLTL